MSTGGPSLASPAASSPPAFLTAPGSPGTRAEVAADPIPALVALACIFLLLASCLLFMMLCKPAALDPGRRRARECMPHHPTSPSEPRLRLWKRLGSLRHSLRSFHRGRPSAPRRPPARGWEDAGGDCDCTEATNM
uniref:uncharacterized protein C10orf105 homolog n=1 Tax=Jaculus jaculus TaxID=51337 RepID=UPI001E1B3287|nr:uncharacterized protein C10orf105 homolog [Jaculus jaculus]